MPLNGRPLHFISGFLGAGKTTLLNAMLGLLSGRRIGVIVNEFGDIGVDSTLVRGGEAMLELLGGQIFCSCLSGSFLEALARLSARDIEAALVETSGLARPASLSSMLDGIRRIGPGAYDYHGMITVVDAVRFSRLAAVAPAVEEQVRFAQVLLLNKVDLVGDEAAAAVEARLHALNPDAAIHRTVRCQVDASILGPWRAGCGGAETDAGWGRLGRPVALTLTTEATASRQAVAAFLGALGPRLLRAKGFVRLTEGASRIDAVEGDFRFEPATAPRDAGALTLIVAPAPGVESLVQDAWTRSTAAPAVVERASAARE